MDSINRWLVFGGVLSLLAAGLHIAVIIGGPDWYRAFGAGEGMAKAAERGSPTPAIVTLGVVVVLVLWALYGFSGGGLIPRLPLLRTGLIVITAIYLLRGLAPIPIVLLRQKPIDPFIFWSSLIVLGYGLVYAIGLWTGWSRLSGHS